MASSYSLLPLLLLLLLFSTIGATHVSRWESAIGLPAGEAKLSTRWAVLVAGSNGYWNYRHQADICHAYQVLKKGGLKDENIVVFMYDDIATDKSNPRPGTIINHPNGTDVYDGVPKDYTGDSATAANLYAVLLGNKNAVKGGSGKVVNSKPNDRIFLYYSDHGGPGVLGMPIGSFVYANDLIKTLKKKHASKGYKEMVIYIEACESGSIFEGILPEDIDVYVTTASGPTEDSWATYCPDWDPPPPLGYDTCLGDAYSVAWMEDSESHNLKKETIKQQYLRVKYRTSKSNGHNNGSHVMEYGNKSISKEKLFLYQGFDPASVNYPPNKGTLFGVVNQRDADLVSLLRRYKTSEHGSEAKKELLKEVREETRRRVHLDGSVKLIGHMLYGPKRGSSVLDSVRAPGLPLVDDWGCLKTTVRTFEKHCGSLTQYGMKHMRAFANLCNSGVSEASVEEAAMAACSGYGPGEWHPSNKGYSA